MRFEATIVEPDGETARELLDADDEQALHASLGASGRLLVRARPVGDADAARRSTTGKLTPRRLLLLTQSLAEALDAGVPLLRAFDAVATQEEHPGIAAMLDDLGDRVEAGQSLSDAMRAHPRAFSSIYCALVRAGEQSGKLPEVLQSIVSFLEWRIGLAATVKQAMVYPALVAAAGYGMVMFLLTFVLPRLGDVLAKMGGDLPAVSVVLLDVSRFASAHVLAILLGTAALVASTVFLLRRPAVAGFVREVASRLPVLREVFRTLNVAQFCRTLAVLLHSGLTMTHALELAGESVSLPRMRARLLAARERILGGARLGEALDEADVLPPVASSMVHVGEEAGRLPVTFERLGKVYDREVKDAVKRALSLLEPAVTVLLGVVVGGVAVLVVLTIYSAMRGVGR